MSYCKICKLKCNNNTQLKSHLKGAKHRARVEEIAKNAQKWRSLEQYLKNTKLNEPVIGLQYVVEFRSPNDELPPHYLCKLCEVQAKQLGFVTHITGWKHRYNYMKKKHADMVPFDETQVKDARMHKTIQEKAELVEHLEGRGEIEVVIEELKEDPALKRPITEPEAREPGAKIPRVDMSRGGRFPNDGPVRMHPRDFPGGRHQDDFPGGRHQDDFPGGRQQAEFPGGRHQDDIPGGRLKEDFRGGLHPDNFPSQMHPRDFPSDFHTKMTRDDFPVGMAHEDIPARMHSDAFPSMVYPDDRERRYPDEFPSGRYPEGPLRGERMRLEMSDFESRCSDMRSEFEMHLTRRQGMDRMAPMEDEGVYTRGSESGLASSAVFECLESFRIENETDAQVVLKITQKLTDILMEYRLRNVAAPKNEQPSDPREYRPLKMSGGDGYPRGPSRYPDEFSPASRNTSGMSLF
ncbi:hypothetical protein AOXY_G3634 [Acipenser oxyrinchus oxyrinchus]|uniref:U1-type domain-containing protein n=1 Tax=Acipenser oxyrinchus oxyrinchus TaxID=40147 RepID=A0AAD8GFU7_ACIOX|nr:hypothetical protein AOXY_G3634 [Acipenser oxyrinchus oxyrinchus]